jgi:Uma2 family endonuclease
MATGTALMTAEEFLALPDDGTDRMLIAGVLKERPIPTRNRLHSRAMTRVAKHLDNWLDGQPEPHGEVLTGDAGVRLLRDPDTICGVDVAYVSAEVMARQGAETTIIDGLPTLAVEILSPSDTVEDVNDKIDSYLGAGIPVVWILDTRRRTVTVYQRGAEPALFTFTSELLGDPHLPGFRVPVRRLFE